MATDAAGNAYTTPNVPASSATLTISARHMCAAPAALVFRNLRNTETWHDWNRFVPRVTIRHQPDDSDERDAMEYFNASGRFQGPAVASDTVRRASQATQQQHEKERHRAGLDGGVAAAAAAAPGTRTSTSSNRDQHTKRTLQAMGGEPSCRLKTGTKMIFHVRMKLPQKMADYTETALVVTEVSRPNDLVNDDYGLSHVKTHTDSGKSGIYRISWATDHEGGIMASRRVMQAQRVHEVRPILTMGGDGREVESCEIVTWECQRGMLAKVVKPMYGKYLQERFDEWVKGLGEFCESMVGQVDRKDFGTG